MVYHIERKVAASLGEHEPDMILKNGYIVNVNSGQISKGDIAIKGEKIVGMYDTYRAGSDTLVYNLEGRYVLPGLIDPHIHIESSMFTPTNFSRASLAHGTTMIVSDPHEMANVLGIRGVKEMANEASFTNQRIYFTVPSCVPALGGEFETSGATLDYAAIDHLLQRRDFIGLGEMMNFPGVIYKDRDVLAKLSLVKKVEGYKKFGTIIDGHAPGVIGKELSAYINAGAMADHECETGEEMLERVAKGMHVMIRQGSSARNLDELLAFAIEKQMTSSRQLMFCSDDKNCADLYNNGHMNSTLKDAAKLIREAFPKEQQSEKLIDIIRMATSNPADFFKMDHRGRLKIGGRADIAVFNDLQNFENYMTFRDGRVVFEEGRLMHDCEDYPYHDYMKQTVNIPETVTAEHFALKTGGSHRPVRIIEIHEGKLNTTSSAANLMADQDFNIGSDTHQDVLKMAVFNRYGAGHHALGFVKGFGIKEGALATTIGHDSHNLGVIGTNDADMAAAVELLKEMQGGIVVVKDGSSLSSLPLPVAGLMSDRPLDEVVRQKENIFATYKSLGGSLSDPIVAMSFLQLPVIPELKLTDKGYVSMKSSGPERVGIFVD